MCQNKTTTIECLKYFVTKMKKNCFCCVTESQKIKKKLEKPMKISLIELNWIKLYGFYCCFKLGKTKNENKENILKRLLAKLCATFSRIYFLHFLFVNFKNIKYSLIVTTTTKKLNLKIIHIFYLLLFI